MIIYITNEKGYYYVGYYFCEINFGNYSPNENNGILMNKACLIKREIKNIRFINQSTIFHVTNYWMLPGMLVYLLTLSMIIGGNPDDRYFMQNSVSEPRINA